MIARRFPSVTGGRIAAFHRRRSADVGLVAGGVLEIREQVKMK